MAKNKDLKVDLDIDTRDLENGMLRMQNSVLKMELDLLRKQDDGIQWPQVQRTIKQSREEFLNRVATDFKETYGYPIESVQLSVRTECGADINTKKTYNIEINTARAI